MGLDSAGPHARLFPVRLRECLGEASSGVPSLSSPVPTPGMSGLWLEPGVSCEAGAGHRKAGRHLAWCLLQLGVLVA